MDFRIFFSPVPTGETTYLGWLLVGLRNTVALSLAAWILALALGTVLGILRIVPGGHRFKQIDPFVQQFLTSAACLGLFTAARVCEQVRAGIESLPRGQKNAGLALGLTLPQTYRYVLLPMAARLIVPPLTSETLNVFKNSAVCSTIGLLELTAQGRQLVDYTAHAYESFLAVTVLYLVVNAAIQLLMRAVESRARVPGYLGSRK